jgi:hypothetical protein
MWLKSVLGKGKPNAQGQGPIDVQLVSNMGWPTSISA